MTRPTLSSKPLMPRMGSNTAKPRTRAWAAAAPGQGFSTPVPMLTKGSIRASGLNSAMDRAMPAAAPLYRHLLFGAALDEAGKATAKAAIERSLLAVSRLVQYGPWLAGEYFSYADISAACVLPLVAASTQQVYGEDLTTIIPGIEDYLALLGKRSSVARTWQDSAAARAAYLEDSKQ